MINLTWINFLYRGLLLTINNVAVLSASRQQNWQKIFETLWRKDLLDNRLLPRDLLCLPRNPLVGIPGGRFYIHKYSSGTRSQVNNTSAAGAAKTTDENNPPTLLPHPGATRCNLSSSFDLSQTSPAADQLTEFTALVQQQAHPLSTLSPQEETLMENI